jgi:lysyl-tRNA synthetase class I
MLLLLDKPNRGFFESLDKTDQEEIRKVGKMLALVNDAKSQDISDNLYEMVKKSGNKKLFGQLYMLLFGRSFGPKLGEFLEGANRVEVIRLLDM